MDQYQINRRQVFSPYVQRQLRGIEIGPGYRPTFPKAEGYSVTVIDCCGTDELRARHSVLCARLANIAAEISTQRR